MWIPRCWSRGLTGAVVLALAAASGARGQAPAAASLEGKKAGDVFRNVQVLGDTPAPDFNQLMHLMKADVGLDCEDCHERDRSSDSKGTKRTARRMLKMMMDLNATAFGGAQAVTCFTCHRGRSIPLVTPAFPVHDVSKTEAPRPALPTADQILAKYVEALGGEHALRSITSRVVTATQDIPTGPGGTVAIPSQLERSMKAPNLVVNVYRTATFTSSDGFDGATLWARNAQGLVTEPTALEQRRAGRSADFYEPLNLTQQYRSLAVQGIELINDREAYLVVGQAASDPPDRLYFDKDSGFLLRKAMVVPTGIGNSPFQVDYDDYRDTGSGVKVPFLIRMSPATARTEVHVTSTIRVLWVRDNVPIEAGAFSKPRSTAPTSVAPPRH